MVDKKSKRIEVLLNWREFALARGHRVPSESDLTKIGASGELWPAFIDVAAAEPWRETIAFLLKQVRFGVVDPVDNLPDDLFDPTPAPAGGEPVTRPERTDSTTDDPRLTALRAWRAVEQARNRGMSGLKDSQLRSIVTSNSRTAEEIRRHLPAAWTRFAPAIAEVVAAADPARTASSTPVPSNGTGRHVASPSPPKATPTTTASTTTRSTAAAATPTAAPDGSAATAVAATEPATGSTPATPLTGLTFVPYNLMPSDGVVMQIRGRLDASGGTALTWPPHEGPGTVVYRVVSGDEYSPYSPDDADEIAVTTELSGVDDRPFTSAVRHVQVWRHVGDTAERAAATQPVLHARTALVAPVQEPSVTEDEGKVIGYWTVLPGATRVQVHRVPIEMADRVMRRGTPDAQFRIFPAHTNLNGFIDNGAERGRRYLYQIWVESETGDGTVLSLPVARRVNVSAVLAPVRDLSVVPSAEGDGFDLVWTPPAGSDVAIFRTEQAPDPGASSSTLADESALKPAGLPDEARLRRPWVRLPDGRSLMANVSLPRDWTRAYFTPVTQMGGMLRLGNSVPTVRIRPIEDARVVERTAKQVVTFAWPEGATSVFAFIGPPGLSLDAVRGGRPIEISRKQYVRQGGMHLVNALPARGCTIHLLPVAYSMGERIEGPPVAVEYPGLLRLLYYVEHQRGGVIAIRIVSEFDLAYRPAFALVHHPARLPLAIGDGVVVKVEAGGGGAQGGARMVPPRLRREAGEVFWTAVVRGLTGYIRVFIDLGDDPRGAAVALIDPPVTALRLPQGTTR